MKQRIIKTSVLLAVFVAALVLSSMITNKDNIDMTTVMAEATLPTISFEAEGCPVNKLVGYVTEMEIPAMRDTILPLGKEGKTKLYIQAYDNQIESVRYQVYTLDGSQVLADKMMDYTEEALVLAPGEVLQEDTEAVLRITLEIKGGETVYYYTRIVRPADFHVKECMDFVEKLHNHMLKKDIDTMALYMEPSADADAGTLQKVTITSTVKQATWGEMQPKVKGDILWDIKETNETYTAVTLKYKVTNKDEATESTYYVEEFFKVRKLGDKFYLLVYERTMEELLDVKKEVLTSKGVDIGLNSGKQQYFVSKEGETVAFVLGRELWCYDRKEDTLSLIFSFKELDSPDSREEYNQHDIRIVSADGKGNLTFLVYGYMNKGNHEGEVGVSVYRYEHGYNIVEEKAFLASDKAFAVAENELCKMVYYSNTLDRLYLLMEGSLQAIDLASREESKIMEGLEEEQYVISEEQPYFAYQKDAGLLDSTEIEVLNMETGKKYSINAAEGTFVRPLGFIGADFVYGTLRGSDAGKTVSGTFITPMYKIDICDRKGQVIKTHEENKTFVSSVWTEENLLTLKRMKKSNKRYREIEEEYIANNQEKAESNINMAYYSINNEMRQYVLKYEDGLDDTDPKILQVKQMMVENLYEEEFKSNIKEDRYYVYGAGKLIGVYDHAGYAILEADKKEGVVVSSKQTYVWERGNYDAWYQIYELRGKQKKQKENSYEACLRIIDEYEGDGVFEEETLDLTGCSVSSLCYMIGKGTPVIAMTSETEAFLLVGYYNNTIVYLDPDDGITRTCSFKAMDEKTEASGNCYVGYAKMQEYE